MDFLCDFSGFGPPTGVPLGVDFRRFCKFCMQKWHAGFEAWKWSIFGSNLEGPAAVGRPAWVFRFCRAWWVDLITPCSPCGGAANLKGYALCRRPLLASRDCHLGALVPPFWHSGSHFGTSGAPWVAILVPREHLGRPFWHLGTTLEDHGSSRMDTKLQMTGFLSILEWFRDLFMSVLGVQNVFKIVLFSNLFPGHLLIDFWLEFSMSGTSESLFSHGRYCKNRFLMEIVFKEFQTCF